ncbi:MAG: Omp28-related outer membrane protein, partial [Paludibacter sp.]|nr:Omp28-related outer membrane protein [Paludibacter sp.]
MKKNYLLLLAIFLFANFAYAQQLELTKSDVPGYRAPQTTTETNDNTLVFQYCTNDIYSLNFGNYTLRAAMVIPKHIAKNFAGKQITKIHVGFGSTPASNTQVFIGESLSSSNVVYTQSASLSVSTWNEITLTTPYTITGNSDVVIGYEGTSATFRVGFDGLTIPPAEYGSYYALKSGSTYSSWYNLAEEGYYNLSIKATIVGDSFATTDISPISINTNFINVFPNEKFSLVAKISNNSASSLSSFKIKYVLGTTEIEKTVSGINLAPWSTYSVAQDFSLADEGVYNAKVVTIEANGAADDVASNDTLTALNMVEVNDYPTTPRNRNVLLEEYTGINCQYCPDGHRRANLLKSNYPGRVGVINIHQGSYAANVTPNYTTTFGNALANQTGLQGYPVGTINRHIFADGVTALNRGQWAEFSPVILASPSPVNLVAKSVVDYSTRTLTVTVNGHYTANSAAVTNLLNVAVLQDSIMGPQVSGEVYYPEMVHDGLYQHNHMLRNLLTGQWGETISTTTNGSEFTKQYVWTIPAAINNVPVNLSKLEILAFIAEGHQEIITSTQATQTIVYSSTPLLEITSAKQLVHHSADLLVKEEMSFINTSAIPVTSLEVEYNVTGATNSNNIATFNLNIASGASATVELPLFYCAGSNAANLSLTVTKINGATYAGQTFITQVSKDVTQINANKIKVEIWQDRYGSETSWKLFGTDGVSVVGSGGPYDNLTSNTTMLRTQDVNITQIGTYRFEIYDSYGDGINTIYGAGHYQLSANGTVFSTGDGRFTKQDTKYIGVNSLISAVENITKNADIQTRVENKSIFINENFENAQLFDITGRKIA